MIANPDPVVPKRRRSVKRVAERIDWLKKVLRESNITQYEAVEYRRELRRLAHNLVARRSGRFPKRNPVVA